MWLVYHVLLGTLRQQIAQCTTLCEHTSLIDHDASQMLQLFVAEGTEQMTVAYELGFEVGSSIGCMHWCNNATASTAGHWALEEHPVAHARRAACTNVGSRSFCLMGFNEALKVVYHFIKKQERQHHRNQWDAGEGSLPLPLNSETLEGDLTLEIHPLPAKYQIGEQIFRLPMASPHLGASMLFLFMNDHE